MRKFTFIKSLAVSLACFGMVIPQTVIAAPPSRTLALARPASARGQDSVILDVALRDGGVLVGQIVTAEGTALAKTPVSLQQNGKELVRTATDANGMYAVKGLRGGVYHVVSGKTAETYRLWAPGTAPPSAKDAALLVEGNGVVRGQGRALSMLSNPWVLTAIIATAIAVPIAVNNSGGSSS